MNEEFEKLIDLALTDGILTEKEKQVLYKKASELGISMDEFEIILQGKLYQSEKLHSKIMKCPRCGEHIIGLTRVCSACGNILNAANDIKGGIKNLDDAINTLQYSIVLVKSVPDVNFTDRIKTALQIFFFVGIVVKALQMIQDKEYFSAIFLTTLGVAIFWIYKKYFADKIDRLKNLIAETEKQKNLIMTYYGENKKVSNYIIDLDNEILKVKKERQSKIRKINIGCLSIIAFIIALYFIFLIVIIYIGFKK